MFEERLTKLLAMLQALVDSPAVPCDHAGLEAFLPREGGVYRIALTRSGGQVTLYVGQTPDLRRRIASQHLGGNRNQSALVSAFIRSGECRDASEVHDFLMRSCQVQVLVVEEESTREALEKFALAVLDPEYS